MITERFHIAVPTAFNEDESLNINLTLTHIENLYKNSIKSVMVCGSTGEQHSLSLDEKIELLNALENSYLIDEMEIIFGVSSIREKEAVYLAEKISKTKISGILLGFSPYILPSQHEAIIYANNIIEKANKDVIIYNNPGRTGFDLTTDSIKELLKNRLIVGLKEAGNPQKINQLKKEMKNNNFYFYAGGEVNLAEKIKLGFNSLSSMCGNIEPILVRNYFNSLYENSSTQDNDLKKVKILIEEVFKTSPISKIKHILNKNKNTIGVCRKPLGN